jgi:AraC family transcriptional regulator of arabinose operon
MNEISRSWRLVARRLSLQISPSENYWHGKTFCPPLHPTNILVFHRTKANQLNRPNPEQREQHHRFVWMIALKGEGQVCLDAKIHYLHEGEGLLILPFQSHCYLEITPSPIHWLFVTFDHPSDDRLTRINSLNAISLHQREMSPFLEFLRNWNRQDNESSTPLYLALFFQHICHKAPLPPRAHHPVSDEGRGPLIAQIHQFSLDNRMKPFSILMLAEHLHISESHLRSRFRKITGMPLGRHLRQLKINQACELLHSTDLQITEIALRSGFESPFIFSRAFRNIQGCTPTAYRLRHNYHLKNHLSHPLAAQRNIPLMRKIRDR